MKPERTFPAWPEEDPAAPRHPAPIAPLLRTTPRPRRPVQRGTLYLRDCGPQNITAIFAGWVFGFIGFILFFSLLALLNILIQTIYAYLYSL